MLPGRVQPSTFGAEGLNFCVRDGNRWDPFAIATGNSVSLSGFRFHQNRPYSKPKVSLRRFSDRNACCSFTIPLLESAFAHPDYRTVSLRHFLPIFDLFEIKPSTY